MIIRGLTTLILSFCFVAGFAQSKCQETVTLPNEVKWGGGDSQGSILIGNTYGPGEGPGIYIAADGGYRLYLNGELLAYDNAAGRVQFIPMTFLPGKNAISVVGINGQDAPGVLVQIDELEKSYYSGSSWRANAAPSDNNWKNKGYEDLQWSYAKEQSGSITSTPSGVNFSGFPANSKSKWIWTSNAGDKQAVLRYFFTVQAVGFGKNTTGGEDAEIVKITTAEELISACESEEAKIILIPEGTIDFRNFREVTTCYQSCGVEKPASGTYNGYWNSNKECPATRKVQQWEIRIRMKSNKSIIGMGRGASLRGVMLYNRGNSNVIMRNLKIWDINPHIIEALDGVFLMDATKMWVDHCSFKWISDGNDVLNSKEATFSWNRWNGYNEFMCKGRDNYSALVQGSDVTYDHIWWEGSNGRAAKVYGPNLSRVYMVNNYHSDNTSHAALSAGPNNLLKVENSHYDGVKVPTARLHGGVIYCKGNLYTNITNHTIDGNGSDWNPTSEPKDATANFDVKGFESPLDNVESLKSICMSKTGAGAQWGTMPKYDDVAGLLSAGPSVSITAPSNGQGLTDPASVTINASASGENGVAKVVFYSGSQKLGEDTSAPYSFTITEPANCTYSIMAVAYDKKGIVAYSTPITFTTTVKSTNDESNLASTYIFTYDNEGGNHSWDYTKNWNQNAVPGSTSTAIIRSGEVHVNSFIGTKTYVESNGVVKITGASTIDNLTLQGGTLSVYTGTEGFSLTSNVVVEKDSRIVVGANSTAVLTLNATISGTGNLTKTKDGTLLLSKTSDLTKYSGNWTIEKGTVKTEVSRMGTGNVYLDGGTLVVGNSFLGIKNLIIKSGGVTLNHNLAAGYAIYKGDTIPAGVYTKANYPDFITGTGKLYVLYPESATYTFKYDGNGNHSWNYTGNWDKNAVPGNTATAIIRSGEVHVNSLIGAKTYVESNGVVKITGASTIDNLTLQGGTLSVYTGTEGFSLTSNVVVEKDSRIVVGANSTAVLTLNATISGTGNLTKTKDGTLLLSKTSDLTKYSGNWTIKKGTVKTEVSRMGTGNVSLSGGTLEVGSSGLGINNLRIDSGKVVLNSNLYTNYATYKGNAIPAGEYTAKSYPDFITGTGRLKVYHTQTQATSRTSTESGGDKTTATGENSDAISDGAVAVDVSDATLEDVPLKLFPNPVKSTLSIQGKFTGNWILYDLQNRKVMTGNQPLVQMEGIKQGIYILKIEGKAIRIIKE